MTTSFYMINQQVQFIHILLSSFENKKFCWHINESNDNMTDQKRFLISSFVLDMDFFFTSLQQLAHLCVLCNFLLATCNLTNISKKRPICKYIFLQSKQLLAYILKRTAILCISEVPPPSNCRITKKIGKQVVPCSVHCDNDMQF